MVSRKTSSVLQILSIALVLAFTSPASALDWPSTVEVGQLLILDAPPGVACTWEVSGQDVDGDPYEPAWREFTEAEAGAVVISTQHRGALTVSLQTDAKRGLRNVTWVVGVGEGDDDSDDDPPPPPPVRLFAVLVYEESDRDDYTKEQLDAIDSVEMREYMESRGHSLRVVDKDVTDGEGNPPASIASFLQRAKAQSLPRIIVADQSSEILVDVMVTDKASTIDALKKYGGE